MRIVFFLTLMILTSSCASRRLIDQSADKFLIGFGDEGAEIDRVCSENKAVKYYIVVRRSNVCYNCVSVGLYPQYCLGDKSVQEHMIATTNIFYEMGNGKLIPVFHQDMAYLIKRGPMEGVTNSVCSHASYYFKYDSLKMKKIGD